MAAIGVCVASRSAISPTDSPFGFAPDWCVITPEVVENVVEDIHREIEDADRSDFVVQVEGAHIIHCHGEERSWKSGRGVGGGKREEVGLLCGIEVLSTFITPEPTG